MAGNNGNGITTSDQLVGWAVESIAAADAVFFDREFEQWGRRWLSGEDRSEGSASAMRSRVWAEMNWRASRVSRWRSLGAATALAAVNCAIVQARWQSEPTLSGIENARELRERALQLAREASREA